VHVFPIGLFTQKMIFLSYCPIWVSQPKIRSSWVVRQTNQFSCKQTLNLHNFIFTYLNIYIPSYLLTSGAETDSVQGRESVDIVEDIEPRNRKVQGKDQKRTLKATC
jgi:hypothetical protein